MRAILWTLVLIAASMTMPVAADSQAPTPTIEATPDASAASGNRPRLGGRHVHIAESPFAPEASAGVWTGRVALITDVGPGGPSRMTPPGIAGSPRPVPRPVSGRCRPVWTGDRMILVGDVTDDGGIETWAYTPATDSWSELTDGPLPWAPRIARVADRDPCGANLAAPR